MEGLRQFAYCGDEQWFNPDDMEAALVCDGWNTADTYGRDYVPAPEGPGIYLFMLHTKPDYEKAIVAYVGMSKNVAKRAYGRHHAKDAIHSNSLWPMVWFKPCAESDLRDLERSYIRILCPPLNIAGLGTRLRLVKNEATH